MSMAVKGVVLYAQAWSAILTSCKGPETLAADVT